MSAIKDENFYTVLGWMLNVLELKGNELIIFAIIYSFSQDGESEFKGALPFLEDFSNLSKKTVITNLASLVEKKYLIKREYRDGSNQARVAYRTNVEVIDRLKKGIRDIEGDNST